MDEEAEKGSSERNASNEAAQPQEEERNPPTTRESLIAAAGEEFAERGYLGARTKSIAERAGVSEVTLFRYFKSKKELFIAVLEGASSISVFDERLTSRLTWDLRTDLKMIATVFFEMTEAGTLAMLTSITEAIRSPEVRELVAEPARLQKEYMSWYFSEQVRRGGCRPLDDVDLTAQAFLALFFEQSIGRRVYVDDPPEKGETVEQIGNAVPVNLAKSLCGRLLVSREPTLASYSEVGE